MTQTLFLLADFVHIWTASSEFGTYSLCEQRRFRRACASAQSRQNLRCSLIQAVSQEEPSDRKPDPWPLWMAEHAQLKFVMTECSKTQIRLTGLIWLLNLTAFSCSNESLFGFWPSSFCRQYLTWCPIYFCHIHKGLTITEKIKQPYLKPKVTWQCISICFSKC